MEQDAEISEHFINQDPYLMTLKDMECVKDTDQKAGLRRLIIYSMPCLKQVYATQVDNKSEM